MKKVTLRTATVGRCFGTCGLIVARNGRVLAETDAVPYGFTGRALELAADIARQRGYEVIE